MENLTDEEFLKKVVENIPEEACKRVHPKLIENIKKMLDGFFPISIEYCEAYESDFLGHVPEMIIISIGVGGKSYNLETGDIFMIH